jgi:membrane-associated phospholipid phosphatase
MFIKPFRYVLISLVFLFSHVGSATDRTAVQSADQSVSELNPFNEEKIPLLDVITEIPGTSLRALDMSFSKKSIPWWIGIIGSTLVLIHNDEVILENWQREGRAAGLGNADNTKAVLSAGEIDLLRLPTDTGSLMYFLGDGWTHMGIAAGFFVNGQVRDNVRAYNTALRLVNGMATSTIFSQFLKRAFGRESPYVRTERFGKWSPFPSVKEYQSKTSSYDAMPSGHVMTATLTFTIINDAYPEYSYWVVPLGVIWVSALSYQMVNNGVHWASDYPLGIAMGYVFAKATGQMGKRTAEVNADTNSWMIVPVSRPEENGIAWVYRF